MTQQHIRPTGDGGRRPRATDAGSAPTPQATIPAVLAIAAIVTALCGVGYALAGAGWGEVFLDEPTAGIVLAVVGGVLAARVPRNPIGWLFLAGGWGGAIATLANAHVAAAGGTGAHGGWYVAASALGGSLWTAPFLVLPPLLLLFPSGRLRSRRWRVAAALGALGATLAIAGLAAGSAMFSAGREPPAALFGLLITGAAMALACLVAGLVHLVLRARAAHGDQRQQVLWLLAGGVATLLLIAAGVVTIDESAAPLSLNELIFATALLPVPVATGVAVLRYRLYDLGRVVSRTVVYGVLTALLLGVYLLLVTGAALLTPTSRTSPLAVAGSTLAAVALFRPLRAYLQAVVDRRFNRRRYDAVRVADAFRVQVRDQVDLPTVTAGLAAAVQRTVQPATVEVWLRDRPGG